MLTCFRFDGAFPQFEVSADDDGFRRFAEVIKGASGSLDSSTLIGDTADAARVASPATDVSSVRVLESENSLVQILYADEVNELRISGGREYLRILAENVAGLVGVPSGSHQHIEWFEGHFYLDAASTPLVLTKMG